MRKVIGWICIIFGILGTIAPFCGIFTGELGLISKCNWFPGLAFFVLYPPSLMVYLLSLFRAEISDTIAFFIIHIFYLPLLIIGIVLTRDKDLSSKWKLIIKILILGYIVISAVTFFMIIQY